MISALISRSRRWGRAAPPPIRPDTPTLTVSDETAEGATLTSSAFASSDGGVTHAASQWQVTTAADVGFAATVISTGDDAVNLESYAASGLDAETDYIARVRHKDSGGLYSNWSDAEAFTTLSDVFTPGDATGLQLDLDPAAGTYGDTAGTTPVSADGSQVARIEDQSGNGRHWTQATAGKRPLLKTGVVNGHPVLRFDTVDDFLDCVSAFSLTTYSIYAVIRTTSDITSATTGKLLLSRSSATTPYPLISLGSFTSRITGEVVTMLAVTTDSFCVGTTDTLPAGTHLLRLTLTGATEGIARNGTPYSLTTGSSGGLDSGTANRIQNIDRLGIGTNGTSNPLGLDLVRLLAYDPINSTDDQTAVEQYLTTRYAIT